MNEIETKLKELGVWSQFKMNIIKLRNRHWLKELKKQADIDMLDCFVFSQSPEGHHFWMIIYNETNT